MNSEHLYEITMYTENQVGLLSTIVATFTRRGLNIDRLVAYPSGIAGIHKISLQTRSTEEKIRMISLQIEKKVDVIKSFYYIDEEHSSKEIESVKVFLEERERNNKQ